MLNTLAATLGVFLTMMGFFPTAHQIQLTEKVGKILEKNIAQENENLKTYFLANPTLIDENYLLHHPSLRGNSCSTFYLALLNNNYTMAVWLLEQGHKIENSHELELCIKRAIEQDFTFDNEYINALIASDSALLTRQCCFETIKGQSKQLFTPQEYAAILKNTKAMEAITAALNKKT